MYIQMGIKQLKGGEDALKKEILKMFMADGKKMYPLDLFIMGIVKRSLLLISGFIMLIDNKNFLSAASLIRLHLDNLLQLYGARLVDDPHAYAKHKLAGSQTKKYKDKYGENMSDNYLKKRFFSDPNNGDFASIENVYTETSGFIHFSDKHIFMAIDKITGNQFESTLGSQMDVDQKTNDEAIQTMIIITYGILKYITSWTATKNNPHSPNPPL